MQSGAKYNFTEINVISVVETGLNIKVTICMNLVYMKIQTSLFVLIDMGAIPIYIIL